MAHQCGTSRRWVGSNGRSEAVGAMLRGKPGVGTEGEREAEVEAEAGRVPLTITPLQTSIDSMRRRVKLGGKGLSRRLEHGCSVGLRGSWCGTPLPSLGRG